MGAATEIFESFNTIFRYYSILSNHLAPSHDIAVQLRDQGGLKHCLTGGWCSTMPMKIGREPDRGSDISSPPAKASWVERGQTFEK
jgi:hypothetical protein